MRVLKLTTFCLIPFVIASIGVVRAQNTTGSVNGTMSDVGGAVLTNATVTLTNNQTGDNRVTHTTSVGDFRFLSVAPGHYTLMVESAGFKRYAQNPVEVQVELTTPAGRHDDGWWRYGAGDCDDTGADSSD